MVQDGGHGGGDAEQDLQQPGQVDVDEVAQLLHHHRDEVEQAVLAAQRQHGAQVALRHGPADGLQAGTCRPDQTALFL